MVLVENNIEPRQVSLKQLAQERPEYVGHILEAMELLIHENSLLRKITSRYSHDLRSPVTNINMLLQLYEKAGGGDREQYIQKMVKSIDHLQEGFENLSAERKNLLVANGGFQNVYLDEELAEVKHKLPACILLDIHLNKGKKISGKPNTLQEVLLLLLEPFSQKKYPYKIELRTEKTWNGLKLIIEYPEFLDLLKSIPGTEYQSTLKNISNNNQILGWNYYFATLFLRTIEAKAEIDEEGQQNTKISILSTQKDTFAQ